MECTSVDNSVFTSVSCNCTVFVYHTDIHTPTIRIHVVRLYTVQRDEHEMTTVHSTAVLGRGADMGKVGRTSVLCSLALNSASARPSSTSRNSTSCGASVNTYSGSFARAKASRTSAARPRRLGVYRCVGSAALTHIHPQLCGGGCW